MKFKIFSNTDKQALESEINNWLKDNPACIVYASQTERPASAFSLSQTSVSVFYSFLYSTPITPDASAA